MDGRLSDIRAWLARAMPRVPRGVRRLFHRRGLRTLSELHTFQRQAQSATDSHGIARALVSAAARGVGARRVALLLRSLPQDELVIAAAEGIEEQHPLSIKASSPFLIWLEGQSRPVTMGEVRALPQWQGLPLAHREPLAALEGELFLPMRAGGTLVGILVLGGRDGASSYAGEEVEALEAAAHQAAAGMEVARLQAELGRQGEELREAREHLARSTRMAAVGEATSALAHEISSPLQTVLNVAHLMAQDVDERGVSRDDIEMVKREALRAGDALRTLQELAREDKPDWSVRDLNALLSAAVSDGGLGTVGSNVVPALQLDPGGPHVWCDREQLGQVFLNLISNALGAMPEGGRLTISSRIAGERVEVRFADTGIGVPSEHLERVFEPFFTTRGEGKGTGLGLAASKMAVEHHQGSIKMDSRVGTGTTVTIWLPLYSER